MMKQSDFSLLYIVCLVSCCFHQGLIVEQLQSVHLLLVLFIFLIFHLSQKNFLMFFMNGFEVFLFLLFIFEKISSVFFPNFCLFLVNLFFIKLFQSFFLNLFCQIFSHLPFLFFLSESFSFFFLFFFFELVVDMLHHFFVFSSDLLFLIFDD